MKKLVEYFTPEHYRLELDIDKNQETLAGRATITGTAHRDQIKLHAVGLTIDSVKLADEPTELVDALVKFTHTAEELTIKLPTGNNRSKSASKSAAKNHTSATDNHAPAPEKLTLIIDYHTKLNHNMQGAYLSTYRHNGKEYRIVATQFESHYARECFPCVDEPAAKATFDLRIIIPADDNDTVLANTPIKNVVKNTTTSTPTFSDVKKTASTSSDKITALPDKTTTSLEKSTTTFETTPRMSTYLLAFVIGEFHHKSTKSKHGVKVTSYCALNQNPHTLDFANHIATDSLDYYDDQFKIKYPLKKLDQVALPDFEAGAMENWGLVTYREVCLLAEPNAAIATKESVALTIAHELSHQWFGNLVTMEWWDDLWLNESFANSIEYFAVDHIHPEYECWRSFWTSDCVAALRRDALPGVQAVHQPVHDPAEIATLFDGAIVYAKGARLMVMLINLMGYDNFLAGIRDYFDKHQYGNTTGDDLWAALQSHADFDVKDFMHVWINRPGYPMLSGDKQTRFYLAEPIEASPSTPTKSIPDSEISPDPNPTPTPTPTPVSSPASSPNPASASDSSPWPLPELKDDMSGHYLLNLSDDEFAAKISRFDRLSTAQRLRLLLDRELLAKTPAVSSASLLDILPRFETTEDYSAWDILVDIVSDLKLFCPPETASAAALKAKIRTIVPHLYTKLGILPDDHEPVAVTTLRHHVLSLAVYAEYQPALDALYNIYTGSSPQSNITTSHQPAAPTKRAPHHSRPDLRHIHPEIRDLALLATMRQHEDKVFGSWCKQYLHESDPVLKHELLLALSDARHDQNLSKILQWLDDPVAVRPQDHIYLYIYLIRNVHSRRAALDWLYSHWGYLVEMTGEKSLEDYPRLTASVLRTRAEADEFYQFFAPMSEQPVLKRTLAIARPDIESRLRLLATDTPAVHEKLGLF